MWPLLLLLSLSLLVLTGCGGRRSGDGRFQQGRDALKQGQYAEAIRLLEEHLDRNPQGRLASRASFLIAKAQLGLDDLDAAEREFQRTVRDFPQSEEHHKARFKLAEVALLRGDVDQAEAQFTELAQTPDGTLAPEAAAMARFLSEVTIVQGK